MTDGIDNTSRRRVPEVLERAREAKVPLYLLGFGRKGEIDTETMRRLAAETGGKFYHATNETSLIEIFENLSMDLHDDGVDETSLRPARERDRRAVLSRSRRRQAEVRPRQDQRRDPAHPSYEVVFPEPDPESATARAG